jgi:RimJ/RimL family protein N-acetyltransferase
LYNYDVGSMTWIEQPLIISGNHVDLISLEQEHFAELETVAQDKRIWQFYAYDGSNPAVLRSTLESGLADREKGSQFPFVIFHKQQKRIIGSTRFMDIQRKHKKLEIGTTWLHPDYWGTVINFECKLLLLTHAFEDLGALRVQFKTDENNIRSRKAIEKVGGKFEGILRNDMLRDNNTRRNSAYFSIIEEEWSDVKKMLQAAVAAKS